MILNFKLDTKAASRADSSSFLIKKSGAYVCKITTARTYLTSSGAQMFDIAFEASEGIGHVNLCLYKKDGSQNFGYDKLMSILTCLRLKDIDHEQRKFKDYNGNDVEGTFYPDLENREIGFLVQYAPEEYEARDGTIKVSERLDLICAYEPSTGMLAKEILKRAETAEMLNIKKANLADKPLKKLAVKNNGFESPLRRPSSQPLDNVADDDVPF